MPIILKKESLYQKKISIKENIYIVVLGRVPDVRRALQSLLELLFGVLLIKTRQIYFSVLQSPIYKSLKDLKNL